MCAATASTSAGSQSKSGKPCERLIASSSAASRDITVKIVVPTAGSFESIEDSGAVGLPRHAVASKMPLSRFLRTRSHAKYCPFIAMYTPGGSTCANDRALPRLKRPSELPNA